MALHKHAPKKAFNGVIRAARRGDLPEIVRIENESFASDRWTAEALGDALDTALLTPELSTLVMAFEKAAKGSKEGNDNGRAAGYGLGWLDTATTGTVASMAVGQDFRGQGLGRQLLDKVIANLAAMGAKKITLQVEATNTAAINLYASSGFVKDRDLKNYYGRNRHGQQMSLKL